MERFKIINHKKFDELPKTAGVYLFKSKNKVFYIGKAANIRSRVKNHFSQPSYRDNLFISKIDKIGYFETNSEIEALVLEAQLIKKYQPRFNVIWRDDKNYFYIAISKNSKKIPWVFITHQPKSGGSPSSAAFIGPFVEGTALKKALRFLRRPFPYYSVKNHPKTKCLYCHLGICPGPEPDLKEYKKNLKKLGLILQGKKIAVLKSLRKEMKMLSKTQKFEKAGEIRDRIYSLQQIMEHTRVIENGTMPGAAPNNAGGILAKIIGAEKPVQKIECYDISNIQGKMATGSMVTFVDAKPDKNQYRKFKIRMENEPNDIAMLAEVLKRRFLHKEWGCPDAILIDGGKAQLNIALKIVKLENSLKIENWKLKILAIAKGRQELFIEGQKNPIPLKLLPQEVYNLIKHLDDEAHRFAIKYHKTLRSKNLLKK